jgi:hypothetical protein
MVNGCEAGAAEPRGGTFRGHDGRRARGLEAQMRGTEACCEAKEADERHGGSEARLTSGMQRSRGDRMIGWGHSISGGGWRDDGRSGAGCRILMAEGRSADSREADFPGAVTCHLFRGLERVDECGRAAANGGDGNRSPTRATRARGDMLARWHAAKQRRLS